MNRILMLIDPALYWIIFNNPNWISKIYVWKIDRNLFVHSQHPVHQDESQVPLQNEAGVRWRSHHIRSGSEREWQVYLQSGSHPQAGQRSLAFLNSRPHRHWQGSQVHSRSYQTSSDWIGPAGGRNDCYPSRQMPWLRRLLRTEGRSSHKRKNHEKGTVGKNADAKSPIVSPRFFTEEIPVTPEWNE